MPIIVCTGQIKIRSSPDGRENPVIVRHEAMTDWNDSGNNVK